MSKIRVVIADDNPKISAIIENGMRDSEEFDVVAIVSDGILALKAVEAFKPDLLLLDIIMPNLDGLGVLEKLNLKKREPKAYAPKVIVLSGVGQDEITYRAMDLGASYYMIKPFEVEVMMHRVRQFLVASEVLPERNTTSGIDSGVVIANVLSAYDLPTHTKGYIYIKEALLLIQEDLTLLNKVTTALYPRIAENTIRLLRVSNALFATPLNSQFPMEIKTSMKKALPSSMITAVLKSPMEILSAC